MATPATLDFDRLLAPISPDKPTGACWREDSSVAGVYAEIKSLADGSRKSERQLRDTPSKSEIEKNPNLPVEKIEPVKWKQVVSRSVDAISTKTKDLWIVAWLIEGLARERGIAGVRDGFRLVRELSTRYWGQLHPPPDPDDLAEGYLTTVVQLAGLSGNSDSDGALVGPIKDIPAGGDPHQVEDVEQCLAEFREMTKVLDEKCGKAADGRTSLAPSSSQLLKSIEEKRDSIRRAAGVSVDASAEGADGQPRGTSTKGDAAANGAGGVMTREAAFRDLLKIADFFQKTEPHSPVSYGLRQIVNWGRMSLPELLTELIPKAEVRDDVFKRTGIPKSKE